LKYTSIQKKSNRFKIAMDREQLASFLGLNRTNLSKELSLLREDKIIDFKKSEFEILKRHL
jgi:CRP-like cAMP-binding protein